MKQVITLIITTCLCYGVASGNIFTLVQDASDVNSTNINSRFESDGSTFIVESVSGLNGDAMRVADLSAVDKPEAVWDITGSPYNGSAITDGFRMDFIGQNNGVVDGNEKDINLRFSNPGKTITSESRVLTTVQFEAKGSIRAGFNDGGSMSSTWVGSFSSDQFAINLFVNNNPNVAMNYSFGGSDKTLNANSYDIWIDGEAQSDDGGFLMADAISATDYDPSAGIANLGFIGSSDADSGMDYLFDDVTLYTASDSGLTAVPEPSAYAMALGILALGWTLYQRRKNI